MNLYRLDSPVQAGGGRIALTSGKQRIVPFFIRGEGDDRWLQFTPLRAQAPAGLGLRDLGSVDYLHAAVGVPMFSEKARAVLAAAIPHELGFYECVVRCQDGDLPFFLARTLLRLSLVDKERSDFRTLSAGPVVLTRTVYRSAVDRDFFIARDADFLERLVVTERFVDLAEQYSLNITFADPL